MKEKTSQNSHYARLRRRYRDTQGFPSRPSTHMKKETASLQQGIIYLYGIHSVQAALKPKKEFLNIFTLHKMP